MKNRGINDEDNYINSFGAFQSKSEMILEKIKELLKTPHSIADIQRKTKMPRSTLNYYLGILVKRKGIIMEREEKQLGRPTIIKLNPEIEKRMKQWEKEKSEMKIEILQDLKEKEREDAFFLSDEHKAEMILDLEHKGFTKMIHYITPEGLKFLKEHTKE